MAELNIDGALVARSGLVQREERLVQMSSGCICCTLREDLLQEVARMAAERAFDYLVIESSGARARARPLARAKSCAHADAIERRKDQFQMFSFRPAA